MKKSTLIFSVITLLTFTSVCSAETFYISPTGKDITNGRNEQTPFRTFEHAFSVIRPGDELILLDGIYSIEAETGVISYSDKDRPWSGQPPSGESIGKMTVVRAKNPGMAIVEGGLFLGRSFRKDSYIKIEGIKFLGGGNLYNTSYVTIKNCGFHSIRMSGGAVFFIGTNDHANGNSYNLIEDCWIWGQERIIAGNYRSDNNVWRRVVIRGDGCNSVACTGSGNPNVGFTVYESNNISIQNMIVIDRVLDKGSPYSDFATAQHTEGKYYLGPNEWLGCISLKAPDCGFYFEGDNMDDFTYTLRDIVAWDSRAGNVNIGSRALNSVLENITAGMTGKGQDSIRVSPEAHGGIVRNVIAYKAGRYGVNSSAIPSYCDVYGSNGKRYNQSRGSKGDKAVDPLTGGRIPSLKYLVRIEEGSELKGTGYKGGDYGANVIKRYGVDGTRYGDPGYNVLTDEDLWPWPNEDRIKSDMSSASKRGFCADGTTLTKYIWEYLGNKIPEEIYGKGNEEKNGQ